MSPQEIRQARVELGLSRSQLAVILDTDTRQIRRLEAEATASKRRTWAVPLGWLVLVPLGGHWPMDWSAGSN